MKKFVAKKYSQAEQGIQVENDRIFSEKNWREAILYYLNGIWGRNTDVMSNSHNINFSGVKLMLDQLGRKYWCYIQPMHETSLDTESSNPQIELHDGITLEVNDDQDSVEIGLMRFVRNDSIGHLTIRFDDKTSKSSLSLHKTTKRGEYLTSGENLSHLTPRRG